MTPSPRLILTTAVVAAVLSSWNTNNSVQVAAFHPVDPPKLNGRSQRISTTIHATKDTTTSTTPNTTGDYAPRTGLAQSVLNWALASPLWTHVLVPQARNTMVQTAQANGIDWNQAKSWLSRKLDTTTIPLPTLNKNDMPDYYESGAFHAYPAPGNLCWEAALEQEIASRAVGARNFPQFGEQGETAFRHGFVQALIQAGASLPDHREPVVAVDLGCGTGLSSRQLAVTEFPIRDNGTELNTRTVDTVIGLDLSPYYIHVGKTLLDMAPLAKMTKNSNKNNQDAWINPITTEMQQRVQFKTANAENTGIPSNSVDVVQILFVLHELPAETAVDVLQEAHRILKPTTGQLWMGEMDFESPAYAAQRANALLFSLLRATEPYLDEYADGFATHIQPAVVELFDTVTWTAATGRHYAMVATKGHPCEEEGSHHHPAVVRDYRFRTNGEYAIEDTHLQLWESKSQEPQQDP